MINFDIILRVRVWQRSVHVHVYGVHVQEYPAWPLRGYIQQLSVTYGYLFFFSNFIYLFELSLLS